MGRDGMRWDGIGWDAETAMSRTAIIGDDRELAWTQAVHGDGPQDPRGRCGCAAGEALCCVPGH